MRLPYNIISSHNSFHFGGGEAASFWKRGSREDFDAPVEAFSITTPARSRSARERRVAILGEEPFQRFPRVVKSAVLAATPSGSP